MPKLLFTVSLLEIAVKKNLQLKQKELTAKRGFYCYLPLLAFVTCLHPDFSVNPFPVLYRPSISLPSPAAGPNKPAPFTPRSSGLGLHPSPVAIGKVP
jgi:hypothetical protein